MDIHHLNSNTHGNEVHLAVGQGMKIDYVVALDTMNEAGDVAPCGVFLDGNDL